MAMGLIGHKAGMTRVFTEAGASVAVTVLEVQPNRVSQIKTVAVDGYAAVQMTAGQKRANKISKAEAGHYSKANVETGSVTREFKVADVDTYTVGHEVTVALFEAGQRVDVSGTSKGKGFAGAVKRHNFRTQDASHGNSLSHRAPGSIGQCQTPGRVWKGKKMAGHMGAQRHTTQSLEIVRVDTERNLLLVKGAVAGAPGSSVIVQPAVKA